jgi:hypothetical protein
MSRLGLWNPDNESDKAGLTWDKEEGPDMFGLGVEHVQPKSVKSG